MKLLPRHLGDSGFVREPVTAGIGVGTKTRFDASVDRSARTTRVGFGVSTKF